MSILLKPYNVLDQKKSNAILPALLFTVIICFAFMVVDFVLLLQIPIIGSRIIYIDGMVYLIFLAAMCHYLPKFIMYRKVTNLESFKIYFFLFIVFIFLPWQTYIHFALSVYISLGIWLNPIVSFSSGVLVGFYKIGVNLNSIKNSSEIDVSYIIPLIIRGLYYVAQTVFLVRRVGIDYETGILVGDPVELLHASKKYVIKVEQGIEKEDEDLLVHLLQSPKLEEEVNSKEEYITYSILEYSSNSETYVSVYIHVNIMNSKNKLESKTFLIIQPYLVNRFEYDSVLSSVV